MKPYNNYFGNTKDNKKMNNASPIIEQNEKGECEDCEDCTCEQTNEKPIEKLPDEGIVDNCSALNLRANPTMDSKILRVLQKGHTLKLIKVLPEGWIEVEIPGERIKGFVKQQFTKSN
jgi:hypothetical protein